MCPKVENLHANTLRGHETQATVYCFNPEILLTKQMLLILNYVTTCHNLNGSWGSLGGMMTNYE